MKKEIEIIAHPNIWKTRYNRYDNKPDKFKGIPFQQKELGRFRASFRLSKKSIKITDEIVASGEIPLITDYEKLVRKKLNL